MHFVRLACGLRFFRHDIHTLLSIRYATFCVGFTQEMNGRDAMKVIITFSGSDRSSGVPSQSPHGDPIASRGYALQDGITLW